MKQKASWYVEPHEAAGDPSVHIGKGTSGSLLEGLNTTHPEGYSLILKIRSKRAIIRCSGWGSGDEATAEVVLVQIQQ